MEERPRRFRNLADEYAFEISRLKTELLHMESMYRKLKNEYNRLVAKKDRIVMRVK